MKRCVCASPEVERVNDHMEKCNKCQGWYAIRITTLEELQAFRDQFCEKPLRVPCADSSSAS